MHTSEQQEHELNGDRISSKLKFIIFGVQEAGSCSLSLEIKRWVGYFSSCTMFPLYQSLYKHLPPSQSPVSNVVPGPATDHLNSVTPESVKTSFDTSNLFAAAMAWHQQTILRSNAGNLFKICSRLNWLVNT